MIDLDELISENDILKDILKKIISNLHEDYTGDLILPRDCRYVVFDCINILGD